MTESRVETMLQQMSLAKPSPALDAKVAEMIGIGESSVGISPRQPAAWRLITAVAVACLLIGIVVGRTTATMAVDVGVAEAAPRDANPPIVKQLRSPSNKSSGDHDFRNTEGKNRLSGLEGPKVAILCSQSAASSEERQCSNCHGGLTHSKTETAFPERVGMEQRFHRQLCAKCHDGTADWKPAEIHDVFFEHPLHKVDKETSPTG